MTDREKLIELMVEAESLCAAIDCYEDAALCEYAGEVNGCAAFRADHLIFNGVVVREKGEWFSLEDCSNAGVYCSVCHKKVYKEDYAWCNRKNKLRSDFCPNCGADMRKGENG